MLVMAAKPAARKTDAHTCPKPDPKPHVGGPIDDGSANVTVNSLPAARKGDLATCVPAKDKIHKGSLTVRVNGKQFARQADPTDHKGVITGGSPNVVIGSVPAGCEFLDQPFLVSGSKADFDKNRQKVTVGPKTTGTYQFPGDKAPQAANFYNADINGQTVKIIEPAGGPVAGKFLPTVDQTAQSLGAVPPGQLATIQQVVLSPNPNPSDAYWAKQYNTPGFTSAATGGNGGVTHYPLSSALTQDRLDSNTIHEGGHTYSQELWKDAKNKSDWEDAIKKDDQAPSQYSESAPTEDFSESLVMYTLAKGTPCEAAARAIYPNRFAVFDKLFAPKPKAVPAPTPGPTPTPTGTPGPPK